MKLDEILSLSPVVPVLIIDDAAQAVPLARALYDGGLRVLEITLRTDAALDAIALIARELPQAVVGAGTVLNSDDYARAVHAGARFIVSPGLTEGLIQAARTHAAPLLPGVATASEVMRALDAGFTHLKFFPAEAAGGVAMLKSWASPLGRARFCPTGGITFDKARDYLALPNVMCVGGSWLAPSDALRKGDWGQIADLARAASRLK